MNYLEVKFITKIKDDVDASSFISNVINSQKSLGLNIEINSFDHEKLVELGFSLNPITKGYGFEKEFTLDELIYLSKQISKIEGHILTHGYITLKVHEDELYFWDTALIYDGVDTFEYCMEYHNMYRLNGLNVLTKSDCISETLLNLAKYTKRYSEPSLEFITQGCLWDKQEGVKVNKGFVQNLNDYIPQKEVIAF